MSNVSACECGRRNVYRDSVLVCLGCERSESDCFCVSLEKMHRILGKPCPVCDFIRCECGQKGESK